MTCGSRPSRRRPASSRSSPATAASTSSGRGGELRGADRLAAGRDRRPSLHRRRDALDRQVDLAAGAERVVVLAPLPQALSKKTSIRAQLDEVAPSEWTVITPDPEALAAFGKNLLDPAKRADAARAGMRQSADLVDEVRHVWDERLALALLAVTWIVCQPVAPSGTTSRRTPVCSSPSLSVARTRSSWSPSSSVDGQRPLHPGVVGWGSSPSSARLPLAAVDRDLDRGDADVLGPREAADVDVAGASRRPRSGVRRCARRS